MMLKKSFWAWWFMPVRKINSAKSKSSWDENGCHGQLSNTEAGLLVLLAKYSLSGTIWGSKIAEGCYWVIMFPSVKLTWSIELRIKVVASENSSSARVDIPSLSWKCWAINLICEQLFRSLLIIGIWHTFKVCTVIQIHRSFKVHWCKCACGGFLESGFSTSKLF